MTTRTKLYLMRMRNFKYIIKSEQNKNIKSQIGNHTLQSLIKLQEDDKSLRQRLEFLDNFYKSRNI